MKRARPVQVTSINKIIRTIGAFKLTHQVMSPKNVLCPNVSKRFTFHKPNGRKEKRYGDVLFKRQTNCQFLEN